MKRGRRRPSSPRGIKRDGDNNNNDSTKRRKKVERCGFCINNSNANTHYMLMIYHKVMLDSSFTYLYNVVFKKWEKKTHMHVICSKTIPQKINSILDEVSTRGGRRGGENDDEKEYKEEEGQVNEREDETLFSSLEELKRLLMHFFHLFVSGSRGEEEENNNSNRQFVLFYPRQLVYMWVVCKVLCTRYANVKLKTTTKSDTPDLLLYAFWKFEKLLLQIEKEEKEGFSSLQKQLLRIQQKYDL